ncbi:MAG: AsmA family protein [Elusimicrobia bacterium]|nr:AsmA family protein [Elusimicrobiota bacterium]
MKILLRILVAFLLFVGILAVGLWAALSILLPQDRRREILVSAIRQHLNREIKVDAVRISLLGGLDVFGFQLSNVPHFEAGEFISSERFLIRFRLLPLFFRRLEVAEIRLVRPRLHLIRRVDGTLNFSEAPGRREAPSATAAPDASLLSPGPSPISLAIQEAEVSQGRLIFENQATGSKVVLEDLEFSTQDFSLQDPFPAQVRFQSAVAWQGKPVEAEVKFRGDVDLARLDLEKARVDIQLLEIHALGLEFHLQGEVHNWIHPEANLQLEVPGVQSKDFPFVPVQAVARIAVPNPALFRVLSSELRTPRSLVKMEGWVRLLRERPEVGLTLESSRFALRDLPFFVPSLRDAHLDGEGSFRVALEGPWPSPSVEGQVAFNHVRAKTLNQELDGVSLRMAMKGKNHLEVSELKGQWNGSDFSILVSIQDLWRPKELKLQGRLAKLDVGKVLKAFPESDDGTAKKNEATGGTSNNKEPPQASGVHNGSFLQNLGVARLTGTLEVDQILHSNFQGEKARLSWDLRKFTAAMKEVTGQASLLVGAGRFENLMELVERRKLLKVVFFPFITLEKINRLGVLKLGLPSLEKLPYQSVRGEYGFDQGVMQIKEFYMEGSDMIIFSKGSVDIPKETLDLYLNTKLLKAQSFGGMAEYLVDSKGRPTLGFFIKGPWGKPSIRPDITAAQRRVTEQVLDKGAEQVLEEGKKFLDKLLKN